jgi:hypothetical protein
MLHVNMLLSQVTRCIFLPDETIQQNLLSSNTAIFFYGKFWPYESDTSKYRATKNFEILEKIHTGFKEIGINNVVYFVDYTSPTDLKQLQIYQMLKKHNVENIINLNFYCVEQDKKRTYTFDLEFTTFNGKISSCDKYQNCYSMRTVENNENLETLMKEVANVIRNSHIQKSAMNISNKPENIIKDSDFSEGEKHEMLPSDVKSTKLLIFKEEEMKLHPPKKGLLIKLAYKTAKSFNNDIPKHNQELEKILSSTKLNCELISSETDISSIKENCYLLMEKLSNKASTRSKTTIQHNWVEKNPGSPGSPASYQNTGFSHTSEDVTITYVSYYLINPKTYESYTVDYGDDTDRFKSMEIFFKTIMGTEK